MNGNRVTIQSYWYKQDECLGRGAFGEVYKGHSEEDSSKLFAIKRVRKGLLPVDALKQEIRILQELSANDVASNNLVKLWEYIEEEDQLYLVMEYCNGGDLDHYLEKRKTMDEPSLKIFLQQIASGMKVMREHGVIHRDLKPANILLSYEGQCEIPNITFKIGDFGVGKFLDNGKSTNSLAGTPVFMAPEVLSREGRFNYKVDLWSIGAIVYRCLTGRFYSAFNEGTIRFPENLSADLKDLIARLLCSNPNERISFLDFYNHSFIGFPKKLTKIKKFSVARSEEESSKCGCCPCIRRRKENTKEEESLEDGEIGPLSYQNPIRDTRAIQHQDLVVHNRSIYGFAYLDSKFFILCRDPNVLLQYLNLSSPSCSRTIDLNKEIKFPKDVASCNISKCLYVTDIGSSSIWKVDVAYPSRITHWVSGIGEPHTISVNSSNGQVTTFGNHSLVVYNSSAEAVFQVSLPKSIKSPQHVVETSKGTFVVSNGDLNVKNHGVCEVTKHGKILKHFRHKSDKTVKLSFPMHLAIGAEDKVFLADRGNNRLLQLNSALKLEHVLTKDESIENPFRLCYISGKGLFVNHKENLISIVIQS